MGTKQIPLSSEFREHMESADFTTRHIASEHAIVGNDCDEDPSVLIIARNRHGGAIAIVLESPDMCRVMAEGFLEASRSIFGTDKCQAKLDA